jgi:hypothetical protein
VSATNVGGKITMSEALLITSEVAGLQAVLALRLALANMAANPLTRYEQTQLARARDGDFSGSP